MTDTGHRTTGHRNEARKPIRTLLVANRGEIACRIMATAREMGIRTVAVFSDPDRLAPHVRAADVAVPLGGVTAEETYLAKDEIMKAAEWQGADAIHPGYGFLSENAAFARAVRTSGRTWIGPPPEAINIMGDKVAAKQAAEDASVPTLPGAILGEDEDRWADAVAPLGYPVLIKAAAGGGGRGMRLVSSPDELIGAVQEARREAQAAFGDRIVFAERWVQRARHVEVQVFADEHGTVVSLGERECSIQRRHQKLIEEAPSPAVDAELRATLGDAAVRLTSAIGYVGAGTVEFLVHDGEGIHGDGDGDARFAFLEMNTRLQVEHPVTEAVTGLDLVRLQIEVAAGAAIDGDLGAGPPRGHAIEARLYAEDPAHGWLPSIGRLVRWRHGSSPRIRYDDGVADGSDVTTYYDPLLSKVIAHAATRAEAAATLTRALQEMQIHGVVTNRDHLVEILTSEAFEEGDTHTDFVDVHPPRTWRPDAPDLYERQWHRFNTILGPHLAAAALFPQRRSAWDGTPWPFAPSGWRNVAGRHKEMRPAGATWRLADSQVGSAPQDLAFEADGHRWQVEYARVGRDHPLAVRRHAEDPAVPVELFNVAIHGPAGETTTLVELIDLQSGPETAPSPFGATGELLVHFGRRAHHCFVHHVGDTFFVNSALGQSDIVALPRFPAVGAGAATGGPVAPVPGRVVQVEVEPGDHVEPGQALVLLEAMKVQHVVSATSVGVVAEVLVAPGDTVEAHQLLIRLAEPADDPDAEPADDSEGATP